MSLKTTNKEARLAIRQYILDHFDPCGYDFTGPCSFPNVARLGLARDLTTVDPDTLPKWYEKIGVSRGIYGMNGGLIWDKVTGEYGVILARSSNLFRLF